MIEKGLTNDVLLAWISNGSSADVFTESLLAAFSEDARRGALGQNRRLTEYYRAPGPYIHDNRSRAARYFLEYTDKQWLWMTDNDMQFPQDSVYRLLEAAEEYDCKILGAAYWNTYPHTATYLSWLAITPRGIVAVPELPEDLSQPVEITATGMGCTLIHRTVLQDVADAYPNDPWDTFSADMLLRFADGGFRVGRSPGDFDQEELKTREMIEEPVRMGEDVTFCLRARRCGYITYGLPSLVVDHWKPQFVPHGARHGTPFDNGARTTAGLRR